ncbi:transcriptional regulator BlaI [Mycobacterium xenopi 4042]|uniref:Transcriptional regulator BlaI n=1 Tax=Mycobacterium xenopi 4042 TaxID=1299334 RepID=X7ZX52_MYCXE|nr:transcriptional regulator BlaI [Mycobacterium xenopi 4042]
MAKWALMGHLERAVMEQLWSASEPQTVRQVYEGLSERHLAYTTIMTVLRRLTTKNLVVQYRDGRAYRYAPAHSREDLVAELMLDALHQTADASEERTAAILHFVELVGADEACALRNALVSVSSDRCITPAGGCRHCTSWTPPASFRPKRRIRPWALMCWPA